MADGGYGDKVHSTAMLEPLVGPLHRAGLAPAQSLLAVGLSEADVFSPGTLVSIDQILAVYRAILGKLHDPMLAYRLGLDFHVTTYGMYGFAILSSADARQAFDIALQYHRLGTPLTSAKLAADGPTTRWLIEPIPHPSLVGPLYQFVIRLHVGIFVALFTEVMGDLTASLRAGLSFDLDADEASVVEQQVGLKVGRADDRQSWIAFDSALLDRPTRMGSPAVNRMLLEICDQQIEALRKREGLAGRLRAVLITNGCRCLGLDEAARRLGMTGRSLRRRLAEEGTSFRAVHDEVQLHTAIGYLRDTDLTIDAIAEALDFSDAANFRRAFRRWAGSPPLHFRRDGARRAKTPAAR
jgi:AraC-like DNA-binding protein